MQKILFVMLFLCGAVLAACSSESGPADNAAQTAAAPGAGEECAVSPPAEPMACTMDWNPVCGCNDVTYGNACGATAAGVPHFTEGACEEERAD